MNVALDSVWERVPLKDKLTKGSTVISTYILAHAKKIFHAVMMAAIRSKVPAAASEVGTLETAHMHTIDTISHGA